MGLDYGIIGNCKTAALISREGSIDWCCFPRFDSPSVFAKLLDEEKGGHFSLTPVHAYTASQSYVAETNVLKTSFTCRDGTFSVIDFFCRYRKKGKLMRDNKIYRLIEVHSGKPQVMTVPRPSSSSAITGSHRRSPITIIFTGVKTGRKSSRN